MFSNLVHDNIGLVHLIVSLISVVTGTMVLFMKKGTTNHKRVGYVYTLNMLAVIITAFMIYRLFGGFGIFHIAAIVSFVSLLGGMLPPLFFRKHKGWVEYHFSFMYWSVMGLYAAFVAETMVRIPDTPFFGMVGIGTGIVMLAAGISFSYYKKSWEKSFGN